MDDLPEIDKVPLLDSMTQPFDQMDFFWSSHDLTRGEVKVINDTVLTNRKDQLIFRDPRGQTSSTSVLDPADEQNDKVILQGCHFQIIVEQNNTPTPVLDYTFVGNPAPNPAPPLSSNSSSGKIGGPVAPSDNVSNASNGSATAAFTKTLGPLVISAIGLKFQESVLQITLDASIKIGPIVGNVKGFSLNIPLRNTYEIDFENISVSFQGIALELDRPPVALAGLLTHNTDGSFQGGVSVEIDPYTFLAGGYYNDVSEGSDTYKSLFVFAQMDGPIVEFEFASLSGLIGGVGYNNQITLPSIDTVTKFPFLQPPTPETNLLTILNSFFTGGWFAPKRGPCWVAGGLTVKAFQTILIDAVVAVDLSDDVQFGIYAHIKSDIPASATNDAELFARVDMGFLAVIDPGKGTFRAEGQLTRVSFILDKDCHLTGGFALCYWFEGSGHEGDWVFTVGGYHSAYSPPEWYPKPARLAISWQYDSLSIDGKAYFAITPKVIHPSLSQSRNSDCSAGLHGRLLAQRHLQVW